MKRSLFVLSVALTWALAAPSTASAEDIPDRWLTVAEKNAFEITASHAQTLEFLKQAAAQSRLILVTSPYISP